LTAASRCTVCSIMKSAGREPAGLPAGFLVSSLRCPPGRQRKDEEVTRSRRYRLVDTALSSTCSQKPSETVAAN
jgi:hypothetical protein